MKCTFTNATLDVIIKITMLLKVKSLLIPSQVSPGSKTKFRCWKSPRSCVLQIPLQEITLNCPETSTEPLPAPPKLLVLDDVMHGCLAGFPLHYPLHTTYRWTFCSSPRDSHMAYLPVCSPILFFSCLSFEKSAAWSSSFSQTLLIPPKGASVWTLRVQQCTRLAALPSQSLYYK